MRTLQVRAGFECVLAVAAVHFVYKALKLVEPSGWNITPGATMLIATALAVRWHRSRSTPLVIGMAQRSGRAATALSLSVLLACVLLGWQRLGAGATAAIVIQRGLFTALGEEVFFRGYVQGRLDGAWVCRRQVLGTQVGWGLAVTAVLFGAIHACNPTLWYRGQLNFDLSWGLATTASGLVFGWLRARTESLWCPITVHALTGISRGLGLW